MSGNQEALASIPLFQAVSKKTIARLDAAAADRTFPAGTQVIREGDTGVSFFMIVSGRVEVRQGERLVTELKAGDHFGEIALLDDERRSASVVAMEETQCLVLSRWDFRAELRQNPDLAVELLKSLSRRLRASTGRPDPTLPPG